jgi:TetR/AcrR family transcriptional repressor of nem operon
MSEIRTVCHLIVNSLSSFVGRKQSASVAIRLLECTILFLIVLRKNHRATPDYVREPRSGDTVMHPGTARSHRIFVRARSAAGRLLNQLHGECNVRKGEETRQEIIRKAAAIFNRKGYSGTALSDLMRATGLEKGGIYRHFESKEELAGDAFDHAWRVAMDARFEGTEEIPNTVDRLKQIVRNFRDRRTGLLPGGCPLLNTAIDSDDGNPQLRAKARQALSSLLDRLQSIADEGQQRGEVRADVDSEKLATLIASTLEGSIMVSRLQKKEEPRDLAVRHLEEHLETIVRALKSKAGADKS